MKASKQINVLGRLAHLLNTESRMCIFRSFVLCHFSYCSLVWHFCGMHNTQKLEKLQERGLRFVFQDFSSDCKNLLLMSNTSDLYTQRLRRLLIEISKTVHNTSFSPLQDIFKLKNMYIESRKVFLLEQDRVATKRYGNNSLTYIGSKLWNDIDNDIKLSESVHSFKQKIISWNGPNCHCKFCLL